MKLCPVTNKPLITKKERNAGQEGSLGVRATLLTVQGQQLVITLHEDANIEDNILKIWHFAQKGWVSSIKDLPKQLRAFPGAFQYLFDPPIGVLAVQDWEDIA